MSEKEGHQPVDEATPAESLTSSRHVDPDQPHETRMRRAALFLLVALAALSAWRVGQIVHLFAGRFTTEDQTMTWLMARDWGRLRPRELTFYGQDYGSSIDSSIVALVHATGIRYSLATPIAGGLLTLIAWWSLSLASWSRGWRISALFAAAAPAILSTSHNVIAVTYIGANTGRWLAMLGLAVLIFKGERRLASAIGSGLLGLALVVDSSAALLVGPILVWYGLSIVRRSPRRVLPALLAGAAVPIAWLAASGYYTHRHPDHALHPQWPLQPSASILLKNLQYPGRLLDVHAPAVAASWLFTFVLIVFLVVWGIWRRRPVALASTLTLVLGLLVLMSLPKSTDGFSTVYFSVARLTTSLPAAAWFVSCITLEPRVSAPSTHVSRPRRRATIIVGLTLVILAIATISQTPARLRTLQTEATANTSFRVLDPTELEQRCDAINQAARAVGSDTVVFTQDRAAAYACSALHPGLATVFPPYERRWWALAGMAESTRSSVVFADVYGDFCDLARGVATVLTCTQNGPIATVTTTAGHPLDLVHALGIPIRPFGDECHPQEPSSCVNFNRRFPQR